MSNKPRKSTIKKLDRLAFKIEAVQQELPSGCEANREINRIKSDLMRVIGQLEQANAR